MAARPLDVLIVTADRKLLRHLSRFLQDFGYVVHQAADAEQSLTALAATPAQIVLVDDDLPGGAAIKLCRELTRAGRPLVISLLASTLTTDGVLEALEAGVDDFLARPIVYGELLARMRAAARSVEYQKRVVRSIGRDALTGLANREALLTRLHGEVHQGVKTGSMACVVLDVDYLDCLNTTQGRAGADALLRAFAETLEHNRSSDEVVAHLGAGRFAVVLPGRSELDAAAWAEQMRGRLAGVTLEQDGETIRGTASFGVYACHRGVRTAEEILDHAVQALQSAKRSGRNCVARFGEFLGEQQIWDDLAAPGRLFEQTVARDVMTPATVNVRTDDSLRKIARIAQRARLPLLPVIDERGKLAGVLTEDHQLTDAPRAAPNQTVQDLMAPAPTSFAPDASLQSLLDYFGRDPALWVMVVDEGRPIGFVTRDNLTALIRPITQDSFAATGPFDPSPEAMVVPDLSFANSLFLTR